MPFFRSLQFRLSALVLLFGALLIGLGVLAQRKRDVEEQLESLRGEAVAASARLAGVAQHVLRRNLPSTLDLELSYIASRREMKLGVVCDEKNGILHATDRAWQGVALEESPLKGAVAAAAGVKATMSSDLVETEVEVTAVAPFLKGEEMRDRAVVVLAYDKQDILFKAGRRAMEEAIRLAAFLFGACLILWIGLNVLVTERVRLVVQQTEQAASDEAREEPLGGHDEFALMSQAFCNSLRLRQELWQAQQPLWRLVEGLKDVFWSVSLQGEKLWYVNPAYEAVWGLPLGDLKANRLAWMSVLAKSDRRRVVRALRELKQGGEVEDLRLKLHTAGGVKRVLCRSFSIVGREGEVVSMAGLVMDVTEHHAVSRRLAEVAEQERRRIGWDLHDDLCQRLVGVLFQCNSMVAGLKRAEPVQPEGLVQMAEEITETTELARGLAKGLAPVLEGGGGMETALEHLALYLRKTFQVRCETALDPRLPLLQSEAAAHLYRIAQELATNAVKHGGAGLVEILFWREDDALQLQVRSNGRPFDGRKASSDKAGMGMHMVRQRLEALGGQIRFKMGHAGDPWNLVVCDVPLEEVEGDGLTGRRVG
jgi:signal transduction histidine kinase